MSHLAIIGNQVWCPLCQDYEKFIKIQNAAILIDVNRRTIYRYLEEGKIYAVKTAGGRYRVCCSCLLKSESKNPTEKFSRK